MNDYIYGGGDRDYLYGKGGNDTLDGDGYAPDYIAQQYGYPALPPSEKELVGSVFNLDGTIKLTGTLNVLSGELNVLGQISLSGVIVDSNGAVAGLAKVADSSFNDTLHGATGSDTLFGGPGNDYMDGDTTGIAATTGYYYNDKLFGQDGADVMLGNIGNDSLDGGNGNDVLSGGSGVDTLQGGNGNDLLNGGSNTDILQGGAGNDIFQFSNSPSSSYIDKLLDFNGNEDVIQLSSRIFTAFYGSEGTQADVLNAPVPSGSSTTTVYKSMAGDSDYLFYNVTNQTLYYDADAIGSKSGLVAILTIGVPVFDPSTIHVDIVY